MGGWLRGRRRGVLRDRRGAGHKKIRRQCFSCLVFLVFLFIKGAQALAAILMHEVQRVRELVSSGGGWVGGDTTQLCGWLVQSYFCLFEGG